MKNKLLITILSLLLVVLSLTGCSFNNSRVRSSTKKESTTTKTGDITKSKENTTKSTEKKVIVDDDPVIIIGDTLHYVKVTDSDRVFQTKGVTEYKIVYNSKDYYETLAAEFIMKQVRSATRASITVLEKEDAVWNENNKYIILNDTALFESAGLKMPEYDIGLTGYYIKTKGNSVFIMTYGNDGLELGSIAFLRALLGYDMLSDDCVIFEKSGETLPDIEIIERPDYDYRQNPNKLSSDTIYGMGFTADSEIWIPVKGSKIHNSFSWLPLEDYLDTHPMWYSDDASLSDRIGEEAGQLCYTAHGNEEEYALMVETAFESAKYAIIHATNQNCRNISCTIQDNPKHCNCEECTKQVKKYGAISATVIHFLNDVDDLLQAWIKEEYPDGSKEVNIVFFAYYATETPPTVKNQDGSFSPVDETVVCNDHVGVYIAPIKAAYNVPFYDEKNKSYADNLRGWAACSKLVYLWLYQTNFNHYIYPMNNWDVVTENYRFGKENNAVFIYDEGQLNQTTTTHFVRLLDYICSKTEFDLNADYNAILDKYFKYYFMDASPFMREYFNELQAYLEYIEREFSDKLSGGIRDNMASTDLWKQSTLEGWLSLIDQALEAVEKYKDTDMKTYDMLVRHIKIESVFPKFALVTLYDGAFDKETLDSMRRSLYEDCTKYSIERSSEYAFMNAIFKDWGY